MKVGVLFGEQTSTDLSSTAVRIEWAKTRARCHRWREEVDLLEEEMARVSRYCAWRSRWWTERQGHREGDEAQLEAEAAYALRQVVIQTQLARSFEREWAHLPALVEQGWATRAGNLDSEGAVRNGDADDEEKDEDGDGEEESEDEEELPISSLPQCPTKPTYVDEVLTM
jgi:hypothetical protein